MPKEDAVFLTVSPAACWQFGYKCRSWLLSDPVFVSSLQELTCHGTIGYDSLVSKSGFHSICPFFFYIACIVQDCGGLELIPACVGLKGVHLEQVRHRWITDQ